MIWTSKKLLDKVLEFKVMTPNTNEWSESELAHNKPRLIRFQQINSLLQAFGITQKDTLNGIVSFIRGEFINNRKLSDYTDLISVIEQNATKKIICFDDPVDLFEVERFYNYLMKYRISAYSILNQSCGFIQASGKGIQAALSLTKPIDNQIFEHILVIDNILAQIIDPERKKIEEKELVDKYGFPTASLDEIDFGAI